MDHNQSAMRIAAIFVLLIGVYWAVMEGERNSPGAGRIGPGVDNCTVVAALMSRC